MNTSTLSTIYKFGNNQIHVVMRDGEPWFLGADVCAAIGVDITSVRKLDDDEKDLYLMQTLGGQQQVTIVSESGMYTLVLRCRDAVKAGTVPHRFRKWVTSEVLSEIRKAGSYTISPKPDIPLLIGSQQQTELERAVHDLATLAGSKGRNYRSTCLAVWRNLRNQFGIREYAQLPAARFQDAMDFVLDKRAEWETDQDVSGYTLENFEDMMHDFYLGGRVPQRVEVELARQLLMRTRTAIVEAKVQLGALSISDPQVRTCVRNAKKILSRQALTVTPGAWLRSLSFPLEAH
jgi:prophage antirepressor-like protein